MTYFSDVTDRKDLKSKYRRLSIKNHPDKGGLVEKMQEINVEYDYLKKTFGFFPKQLDSVRVGNFVYVNQSTCVVLEVERKLFKVKSFKTNREAIFDKATGLGLFNFKIQAYVN